MSFVVGLILMVVGFLMVAKTEWLLNNFGRIEFFEEKLGTEGGSRLGYKLLGILLLAIGFMCVTGLINPFLYWLLGPLIRAGNMQ